MTDAKFSLANRANIGTTAGYSYTFNKYDDKNKIVGSIIVNDYEGDGFDSHDGVINKKFGVVTNTIFDGMMAADPKKQAYRDVPDVKMNPTTDKEYVDVKGAKTTEGFNITSPETEEFNLGSLAKPLITSATTIENNTNKNTNTTTTGTTNFIPGVNTCPTLPLFPTGAPEFVQPQMNINPTELQNFFNCFSSGLAMFGQIGMSGDINFAEFFMPGFVANMWAAAGQLFGYAPSTNVPATETNQNNDTKTADPAASTTEAAKNDPAKTEASKTSEETKTTTTTTTSASKTEKTTAAKEVTSAEPVVTTKRVKVVTEGEDKYGNPTKAYADEKGNGIYEVRNKITGELISKTIAYADRSKKTTTEHFSAIKGQKYIPGEKVSKLDGQDKDYYARSYTDKNGNKIVEYYYAENSKFYIAKTTNENGDTKFSAIKPGTSVEEKQKQAALPAKNPVDVILQVPPLTLFM